MSEKFRFLDHTADVEFEAFGKSMDEVFENSAYALFNAMYKGKVEKKIKKDIKVEGGNKEALLYDFLEELIYLLETQNFFLSEIKVKIKDMALTAEVWGDKASNYEISLQVKAITYHDMLVEESKGKWITQVVVDV